MPCETDFANSFEDAQLDVERRENNANQRRTMLMWRNAFEHTWETRPMSEIHKLIDRQPKIQKAIVEAEGDRVNFELFIILVLHSISHQYFVEFSALEGVEVIKVQQNVGIVSI